MLRFAALMLLATPAYAQLVELTQRSPTLHDQYLVSVTGNPCRITLTFTGGVLIDQLQDGWPGTPIATTPALGANNDVDSNGADRRYPSVTFDGPLTNAVGEFDGGADGLISGGTAECNGEVQPLVLAGTTWSATFTGTVVPPTTGAIDLTCTAPTQNEDGSALTDLAGYRFYWGAQSGAYPSSETVNDPSVCAHTLTLPVGTYFFVATALNSSGVESVFSNVAQGVVEADAVAPGAPIDLGVPPTQPLAVRADDLKVYNIRKAQDESVMVDVGTFVPAAACNPAVAILSRGEVYYGVARAEVASWYGIVRSSVVYARCQ